MSTHMASCCHEVDGDWLLSDESSVVNIGYDRYSKRCIEYQVVCRECKLRMQQAGLLLRTEEEMDAWLQDGTMPPIPTPPQPYPPHHWDNSTC